MHNFPEICELSCYVHTTMYIYAVLMYYGPNLARMLGTVGNFWNLLNNLCATKRCRCHRLQVRGKADSESE